MRLKRIMAQFIAFAFVALAFIGIGWKLSRAHLLKTQVKKDAEIAVQMDKINRGLSETIEKIHDDKLRADDAGKLLSDWPKD